MMNKLKQLPLLSHLRGPVLFAIDPLLRPLRKDVRRLSNEVARLEQALRDTTERAARADRQSAQLHWTLLLDAARQQALARRVEQLLDPARIGAHVAAAIAAAPLQRDPFPHTVVDGLLPDDVYALLIDTIPPVPFFSDADPVKQDLPLPIEFGPALHLRVWNFVDAVIAREMIQPAMLEKFHAPLQDYLDVLFGPEFREAANALPHRPSGGRVMLRRPGYHLGAHRDPKRSLLTCLLYLARPGDDEAYGTRLYRVTGDSVAHYKQTYYPEREGHACELVTVVPFRPNSMLVFQNSGGAHGAGIPVTAPAGTERYSYQFYVAPEQLALRDLIKSLPKDRRDMWKTRSQVDGGAAPAPPAAD